ncbi:L-aspartate oxidase [Herbiconiux sp. YIM B11900]|uniref:L-aspartate oxidase n=1 Tax=Herbiconiux sp. YIM B11900 TaxID=3404131 RepID=UPI003F82946B
MSAATSAAGRGRARRVVVVGSGVAGLVTALTLKARCRERGVPIELTVVTKSTIDDSNTRYAQGGIAAAVMPGDTVESHVADTLAAGAGLSDPAAVAALCGDGPERIRDLIAWGVGFDREGGAVDAPFDAGLEGAHSMHRILHAGGDATGLSIESALVRAVRWAGIAVMSSTFLADLVTVPDAGRVVGVEVVRGGAREVLAADAVVLASGGIGQLYPFTTNPIVATGDGAAAAWRAGAVLADVEFVQFHPTALAVPGAFLVSEAVRGDGAVLVNGAGERFMVGRHPLAELAPRDVVAREIAAEMRRSGQPVRLDATGIGVEELGRRFPTISAAMRQNGLDWAHEPVPVAPAAHYWMGGVATDLDGRTSVPGLWAVGEVSCTGVHGANRLASNSLLESLVFAHRAATALAEALAGAAAEPAVASAAPDSRAPAPGRAETHEPSRAEWREPTRAELHELMWASAGVGRDGDALRAARATLAGWGIDTRSGADLDLTRLETANLVQIARLVVESALAREESRGAHFRGDFPGVEAAFAGHLVLSRAHPSPRLVPTVAHAVTAATAAEAAPAAAAAPDTAPAPARTEAPARTPEKVTA